MCRSAVLRVCEFLPIGVLELESEARTGALDQRDLLLALLAGHEQVALKTPIVHEPAAERVEQPAIELVGDPRRADPEVGQSLEVRPSIIVDRNDLRLGEEACL
jgi:hypothetical protein